MERSRSSSSSVAKAPAAAVVMLRQELLDRRGFAKRDVRSKAYCRDGKRGL
ncbi:hypothetical protein ACN6A1_03460 [Myxococcus virescens]|uniref:hypothetical protein n=1 Tax=Myxococcus virescens TaxID=83456 RepID=UPI003DA67D9A